MQFTRTTPFCFWRNRESLSKCRSPVRARYSFPKSCTSVSSLSWSFEYEMKKSYHL